MIAALLNKPMVRLGAYARARARARWLALYREQGFIARGIDSQRERSLIAGESEEIFRAVSIEDNGNSEEFSTLESGKLSSTAGMGYREPCKDEETVDEKGVHTLGNKDGKIRGLYPSWSG